MIETRSAAFLQSSGERRSPLTSSTLTWVLNREIASSSRASLLEGRTKHRRLRKPYSRRISTTFAPIKPFDPVTRTRSAAAILYSVMKTQTSAFSLRSEEHTSELQSPVHLV